MPVDRRGSHSGPDHGAAVQLRRHRPPLPVPVEPALPSARRRHARDGGDADVRWFDVGRRASVFHPMNAYDDGDTIVLDVARHPKMLTPNSSAPTIRPRWTAGIDPPTQGPESASTTAVREFRVDERLVGKAGTATATHRRSATTTAATGSTNNTTSSATVGHPARSARESNWASSSFTLAGRRRG